MTFSAYVVDRTADGFTAGFRTLELDDLDDGDVLVRVRYSSVNYKDGLANTPDGRVVRRYPCVPGIDLAGVVEASQHPDIRPGEAVFATGFDLGVSHHGGYAEFARLPAAWLLRPPEGLTLRDTMALGTAGFTAALAIQALERHGVEPGDGDVLVTGAGGGVGSLAVALLARAGYRVVASTGRAALSPFLQRLGAAAVIGREEVLSGAPRGLGRARWAAVIDTVGGATLAHALSQTKPGGAVASIGLAGGAELDASVFPFILRGVALLGIDSAYHPAERRPAVWARLAGPWRPPLDDPELVREIPFSELPSALTAILAGRLVGRTVVTIAD
jgi:acrylyl-CoA reductase (NADPH)